MDRAQLVARWLSRVDSLDLSVCSSAAETARQNRTSFALHEAKVVGASAHDLADFLERAFRAYCRAAARIGLEGWFYAWFDEMAGTLNCSACDVPTPEDLPFACRLDVRFDTEALAQLAVQSPYAAGIPAKELTDVEWTDPDAEPAILALVVYAKPLLGVAGSGPASEGP